MENSKILRQLFAGDKVLDIAHKGARRSWMFRKLRKVVEKHELEEFAKACPMIQLRPDREIPIKQAGKVVGYL